MFAIKRDLTIMATYNVVFAIKWELTIMTTYCVVFDIKWELTIMATYCKLSKITVKGELKIMTTHPAEWHCQVTLTFQMQLSSWTSLGHRETQPYADLVLWAHPCGSELPMHTIALRPGPMFHAVEDPWSQSWSGH